MGERWTRVEELEAELREAERRLEETQALARVGSWEWDLPARQASWSRELLRTFGRDPDGRAPTRAELLEAIHPEDRAAFEDLIVRLESTPGRFDHSYRIVDPSGETRHMQARGYVEVDATGKPCRTHGTTQDVTELKESQAQLERARRLEGIGQLAGGVAHDFNNLLSAILNYAEYAADASAEEETVASLREIEKAALSAAGLTRQLLVFSRRGSGEPRPIDLAAAVAEAGALLRRTIGDHIKLTTEIPAALPPVRLGDGQAQQILVNLAVNARDALPGGGTVAVAVRELGTGPKSPAPLAERGPGERYLVLEVSDDGAGMSEEVAAQAFDPFFTTKPRGQGTGLGLATVYGIARRVGGEVEIESAPGHGTTVSVYLPVSDDEPAARPSAPEPAPPAGSRSVLVVDNEEAVRTIVSRMLARHGYEVRTARGGPEAEALLAEDGAAVDLLLTDLLMPGTSGRELAERLRGDRPGLRVLYMSGYGSEAGSPLAPGDAGATVLQKPFTGEQLLRAVGEALAAR